MVTEATTLSNIGGICLFEALPAQGINPIAGNEISHSVTIIHLPKNAVAF